MKKYALVTLMSIGITTAGLFLGSIYFNLGVHGAISMILGGASVGVGLSLIDSISKYVVGR